MAFSTFEFEKSWNDHDDFKTYESSETQVRLDLQELHDETRDFINDTLVPEIEDALGDLDEGKQAAITANGVLKCNGSGTVTAAGAADVPGFNYATTAPEAANTDGLKVVVLTGEPETKYAGWLYIITEA